MFCDTEPLPYQHQSVKAVAWYGENGLHAFLKKHFGRDFEMDNLGDGQISFSIYAEDSTEEEIEDILDHMDDTAKTIYLDELVVLLNHLAAKDLVEEGIYFLGRYGVTF